MKNPLARLSLKWKIALSTSVAITALFAVTGWMVVANAARALSESVKHEAQAGLQAYESLWSARAERLASISAILSTMSDVRAAFGTGDAATIRDTAAELWARASAGDAVLLVTDPAGRVIASVGDAPFAGSLDAVRQAQARFPAQSTGFVLRGGRLYHLTVTPVFVQSTGGTALLNVLVAGYEVTEGLARRLRESTGGSEFVFLAGGRVIASSLPDRQAEQAARALNPAGRVHDGASEYQPLVSALPSLAGEPAGQVAILRSLEGGRRQIRTLRRNIALLWLASMFGGVALTYALARRFTGPVEVLDRAAAEVARQNYDCQVPVQSEDELGRLASTFNDMCASIRRAREDLIRSERIAMIGRLATSIVHDLRNPLGAIYGGAEMLLEEDLPRPHAQRLARNMFRASQDIQRMLDHLLEVSRGRAEPLELCRLRDVAASAAESLAGNAEANGVAIRLDLSETIELPLERNRMERVFANLIGNAVEAMPQGGQVTVEALREDGSVVVRVRDTGAGIPPEVRARLFQPFVTSKKRNGLGLGLALSRQAVLDRGGDMWVEAASEGGACFVFRLPER